MAFVVFCLNNPSPHLSKEFLESRAQSLILFSVCLLFHALFYVQRDTHDQRDTNDNWIKIHLVLRILDTRDNPLD